MFVVVKWPPATQMLRYKILERGGDPVSSMPIPISHIITPITLSLISNMATPKEDNSSKRRCTCAPKVEGSSVDMLEKHVASMTRTLSDQTLIGTWSNPCSPDSFLRCLLNFRISRAATNHNSGSIAGLQSLLRAP